MKAHAVLPSLLTVHVSMQPEYAGVRVSQRAPQAVAALLAPLLRQPAAVWDARLLVDLKTPADDTRTGRHAGIEIIQ